MLVRYDNLRPASTNASRAARGASKKRNTGPELLLRKAIRDEGLRSYRIGPANVVGRPDIAFPRERVAVFCDGDFWHGRDLTKRIAKLEKGHNAPYWIEKIKGNVARDRRTSFQLETDGWTVLRFWETDVKRDPRAAALSVANAVAQNKVR